MKHAAKKKSFFQKEDTYKKDKSEYESDEITNELTDNKFKIIITTLLVIVFMFFIYNGYLSKYTAGSTTISSITKFYTFVVTMGLIIGINYLIISKDVRLEKLFLIIIIPISIVYSLILIPGMVPDEGTHMRLTYSLASQIMGVEGNSVTLRGEEKYIYEHFPSAPNEDSYEYTYTHLFSGESNGEYVEIGEGSATVKQLFGYFPAVIGVIFSRIMHFGATPTLYIARYCNMAFYITVVYFALRKIPIGKQLLFSITLLPMCCQQMMSLSYDVVLNASAFFCIAYGLFFVYCNNEVRVDEYIKYILCGVLLLSIKSAVYSFLLMIPIFARFRSLSTNKKIERKQKLVIFLSLAIAILLLNFVQFNRGSSVVTSETAAVSQHIISWSGTEGYSINWLLQNPISAIKLFINTFHIFGKWYFYSCLGQDLSWFTIKMDYNLINMWFVLLIISALCKETVETRVTIRLKILFTMINFVIIFLVLLSMCIYWTPLSYDSIQGVQGRYFIPIVFTIIITINNSKISITNIRYKYINIAAMVLVVFSIINLVNICYI